MVKEQIKALSKISMAITSDLYLDEILRLIVTATAEVIGSTICSIMIIDEEKGTIAVRASQSISQAYNKKRPLMIGEGIAGNVAKLNKLIMVRDVRKEAAYTHKDIAKKEGLCSLLCVPLSVKHKVIGVLNCYTSKPHDFTEIETDILTSVANQAAVAIENATLLAKTKVVQEELETRKRVERAKGILMKSEHLTEEEAYLKLQRFSMDRRKNMREVAEAIILSSEIKR